MHEGVCVYTHVYLCAEARGQQWLPFSSTLYHIFRDRPYRSLLYPQCYDYGCMPPCLVFVWEQWIQTLVLVVSW